MRGLAKLSNAANRQEAVKDWNAIAQRAVEAGRADLVRKHVPPFPCGWRTIDKRIARLRTELQEEKDGD